MGTVHWSEPFEMTRSTSVLEFGTFTGFSALAWYEGTRSTNAEIITLERRNDLIDSAKNVFEELGVDDRIKILPGPAQSS